VILGVGRWGECVGARAPDGVGSRDRRGGVRRSAKGVALDWEGVICFEDLPAAATTSGREGVGGITISKGDGEVEISTKSPPRRTVGGPREAPKSTCRGFPRRAAGGEVCLCTEPLHAAKRPNPVRRIYKKGKRKNF
jgi:hypothetical protein